MIVNSGRDKFVYNVENVDSVNFMEFDEVVESDIVPIQGWINPLLSLKGKLVAFLGIALWKAMSMDLT